MGHWKSRPSPIQFLQILFLLLFLFSLFMIWREYSQGKSEQAAFESLKPHPVPTEIRTPDTPGPAAHTPAPSGQDVAPAPSPAEPAIPLETPGSALAPYAALQEANPDFTGWLTIENTGIDYPVMYTPDNPQFYLRRAFDKSKSRSGTPFLGEGCDMDSDCVIIYGHNMNNGTMFGTLDLYLDEDFWGKTPSFTLTTPTEVRSYDVFAAVQCRVLSVDEEGFRYYDSAGELSEAEYTALLDWLTENACYQTGILPVYGEQLLLLSTCSYHTEDGRFIVAARRNN